MTFNDRVYGTFEVVEPVLIELIESPSLQRLKEINQLGLPDRLLQKAGFTRFEHSVGTMQLLNRLGATLEEQTAGLLHDVSHTAFSHLTDWIYENSSTEDGQDKNHTWYIQNSELPEILARHGYSVERVCNHDLFGLLERDAPDLCADRVDYALRESPQSVIDACADKLVHRDGKMVFADQVSARVFGDAYKHLQDTSWASRDVRSRYRLMGDALKIAIEEGIVNRDDLWLTDEVVLEKLTSSGQEDIGKILHLLEQPDLTDLPSMSEATHVKFRHVDPLFVDGDSLSRLSTADPKFKSQLDADRLKNEEGLYIVDVRAALSTISD